MVNKLYVLLWKHFVVRRRRFIHTPIEWFSPIIFFILLFVSWRKLNPESKYSHGSDQTHFTEPRLIDNIWSPNLVFFAPVTDVTTKLMREVGEKLNLPKGHGQPEGENRGYFPIFNDPFMIKNTVNNLRDYGVVIFENINEYDTKLPERLNYTIRMPLPYRTIDNSYNDEVSGFHSGYGYEYEQFVRVQWAVDSSFLELKTGHPIPQKVSMQEFPYATSTKNPDMSILGVFLIYLSWISLLLPFVFLSTRLLAERVSGIREMIHMSGVPSYLLHLSHFINVVPAGLVFSVGGAALITASTRPLLASTNPFLIWLMLALYFINTIAIAYVTSCILKKVQYGVTLSCLMYTVLLIPAVNVANKTVPPWAQAPTALLPNLAMMWFFKNVIVYEQFGWGVWFSNITLSPIYGTGSPLLCLLMMMVQPVLVGLLAWYLERVRPGPYGQAQPWNFICQRDFWWRKKVEPYEDLEETEMVNSEDPQYFEPSAHMKQDGAGIKVVNVSKYFPKHKALSNVSMNIAKGEITVLLGHNGAGKTTLMSIITGILSPSEGSVYIGGLDASKDRETVRKQMGLCPQHNLFFSDLTVLEHVMFYTLLKGHAYGTARKSSMALLAQLGIGDKAHMSSGALSGGMKRRLQLACALAGDARVLVLDEPTSGLDVETRRGLWDLLLSLRGDRVVLISTHFMEEADALGDRVAALQAGRLRCFASPMYLKRALGTGYQVTCTTVGEPNEAAITDLMTSHVAGATLHKRTANSVTYALPAEETHAFPKLFGELEERRSKLKIDTVGVGASTLEEVFLKLCSDTSTEVAQLDEVDAGTGTTAAPEVTGVKLYARQFCALFLRHFKFIAANKITFIVLQIFIPLLVIIATTFGSNNPTAAPTSGPVPMNLALYDNTGVKKALYSLNTTKLTLRNVETWYPGVEAKKTANVADEILRIGQRDIMDYNKYLVGVEINDNDAKFLYTTVRLHAAPVAANLLSNMLGAALGAGPHAITTNNQPTDTDRTRITRSKNLEALLLWTAIILFVIMATTINAVTLPCRERVSGARHLQVLAGVRAPLPWLAALAAHTLTYTAVLVVPVIIAAAVIDRDDTINQPDFLGVLLLILLIGIPAFLSFSYLLSFCFGERATGGILTATIFFFGFITPIISTMYDLMETFNPKDSPRGTLYYVVVMIGYVMPPHQLVTAVMTAAYVASNNAEVKLQPDKSGNTSKCYLCFDEYTPALATLILSIQFVAYMTLVILTEHGVFGGMWERVASARYAPTSVRDADDVVRAETEYVRKAIELHGGFSFGARALKKTPKKTNIALHGIPVVDMDSDVYNEHIKLKTERGTIEESDPLAAKDKIKDALLAYDLHKRYMKVFGKACNAVKGVSFSVKKGEVFGLLGVNGAGKTTIFKMLTGLERPTRGRVFAAGHHLAAARHRYLRSLGYCPQFGGVDTFLSGEDNLRLLLALRGLSSTAAAQQADRMLEAVGLQRLARRPVSALSGGCARRLAAAAALCGTGRVILLDEPSAGVDVSARRLLWAAMRSAASRAAVVVSSHSMDETEALCGRIAIVAGGHVRALGSAAALRAQHAAGYALVLRVAPQDGDETDGGAGVTDVSSLKSALHQTFNCTLKDEHKTMLHYHIQEALPYSELFARLEQLRASCPLVQDYAVAETTLEEVFLTFARDTTATDGPTPV